MSDLDIYRAQYLYFLETGDDEMNARLRIIELGASLEEADAIQALESDVDDEC